MPIRFPEDPPPRLRRESLNQPANMILILVTSSFLSPLGGHSRPRTHRAAATAKATNIGGVIMHTLIDHIQSLPPFSVQVLTNTRALELLQDSRTGRVKGVRCRSGDGSGEGDRAVEADAVVLATGGYSADREGLLQKHVPGAEKAFSNRLFGFAAVFFEMIVLADSPFVIFLRCISCRFRPSTPF